MRRHLIPPVAVAAALWIGSTTIIFAQNPLNSISKSIVSPGVTTLAVAPMGNLKKRAILQAVIVPYGQNFMAPMDQNVDRANDFDGSDESLHFRGGQAQAVWAASTVNQRIGSKEFTGLTANTRYKIRFVLYTKGISSSEYRNNLVVGSPVDLEDVWTKPAVPAGYQATTIASTSVTFTGGSDVPEEVTRRFFAKTDSSPIGDTYARDGYGFSGITPTAVMGTSADNDAASVTFTGLTTGMPYYFFFIDHSTSSDLYSEYRLGSIAPQAGALLPPAYTVKRGDVTATTIPLEIGGGTQDLSGSHTLIRRFFVNEGAQLELDTDQKRDGVGVSPTSTFTVSSDGTITIGDTKGAGTANPTSGMNPVLTANKRYFIYATDYDTSAKMISPAHDIAGTSGIWTLPAAVTIDTPTGDKLTHEKAQTSTSEILDSDTQVYWVLLKEPLVDLSGLTGENIKNARKGENIVGDRVVVNRKTVSGGRKRRINFLEDVTPISSGTYAFYYVAEGQTSGLFGAVKGGTFVVPRAALTDPRPNPPVYAVDADAVTDTKIPLKIDLGTDVASPTLIRRFFVNAGTALNFGSTNEERDLNRFDAHNLSPTSTFTVNAPGTVVIGNGKGAGDTHSGMPISGSNPALMPNTKYFIYVTDYDTDAGSVSQAYKIAGTLGAWTAPAQPTGYDRHEVAETSVTFEGGGDVPDGVTRRFYASTTQITMFTKDQVADEAGFAGIKAPSVQGTTAGNDGESVTFPGLVAGTPYYFYFIDYNSGSMRFSSFLERGSVTPEAAPLKPAKGYTQNKGPLTTTSNVRFEDGPGYPARATTRHFFYTSESMKRALLQRGLPFRCGG